MLIRRETPEDTAAVRGVHARAFPVPEGRTEPVEVTLLAALRDSDAWLLGEPGYYGRFGFVPASDVGVEAPDPGWREYFQVRTLAAFGPAVRGRLRYAAPFDDL